MLKRVDIRKQSSQDKLSRLQKVCLPYDQPIDTNFGSWWIATENGVDIGFAGLVRTVSWTDCGYLCRAGVIPDARGQGLQKKLINVRVRQAKALGWNWVVTDTRLNPASANSLISCGFKMFEPSKPWGCKDTLYWRKKT
jgi:GNAT superfamily N-acetyltransferase